MKISTKLTRYRLKGTTDVSGDAVVTTNNAVRGKIHSIICNISALDAGADTTITTPDDVVTQTILNLSNTGTDVVIRPKVLATDNAGGALTATGNTFTQYSVMSRLTATVAQGGNTKAFTIDVYVEEY